MPANINLSAIEAKLADPKLKLGDLSRLIRTLGLFKGFKPTRGFPIGIPFPDGFRSQFDLDPAGFRKLNDNLLGNTDPMVRSWRVFPRGIINPDRFTVEVDIGRPHNN